MAHGIKIMCVLRHLSHVQLFATPWTVARQAPLSIGIPRQEYSSGSPFSSLGDLSDSGIESASPVSPALAGRFFTAEPPGKPYKGFSDTLNPFHFIAFQFM